ncbi:hypothetical protein KKG31_05470 [Patescibacteria group bacterium]|nr:hypothetical protein [Patescibacteria group bacterium]
MKPNSSTQYEIYENYGTAEYDNSVSQEIFSELKWNGIKTNTEQDPKVKKDIAVIQGL